jgi:hypothetical protein
MGRDRCRGHNIDIPVPWVLLVSFAGKNKQAGNQYKAEPPEDVYIIHIENPLTAYSLQ